MTAHEKIISKGVVSELRCVCAKILDKAKELRYSEDAVFAMNLAMEEAFVNAVKHGNKGDENKNVVIEYDVSDEKVDISVTDQGQGFAPEALADPRCGDNIFSPGGRGVLLVKSYMDVVEYNEVGNSVRMVKYKS